VSTTRIISPDIDFARLATIAANLALLASIPLSAETAAPAAACHRLVLPEGGGIFPRSINRLLEGPRSIKRLLEVFPRSSNRLLDVFPRSINLLLERDFCPGDFAGDFQLALRAAKDE
jgi:hypothetical protein